MSGKLRKVEPILGPAGAVYGIGLIGADNALCMEGSGGARSYSITVWQFPHGYAMPGPEWQPYLDLTIAAINTGVELEAAGYDPLAAIERLPAMMQMLAEFEGIMADSRGVDGYHMNGDIAEWGEFEEGDTVPALLASLRTGTTTPPQSETVATLTAQRDALAEALQGLANALEITPGPRGVLDLVPAALEKAHAALAALERAKLSLQQWQRTAADLEPQP